MSTDTCTSSAQRQQRNLVHLGNVAVEAVVELDRRRMPLRELRRLRAGDVIISHKLAGEAFTLRIEGAPFAEGETTMAGNQLCLRLTRLLAPPSQETAP